MIGIVNLSGLGIKMTQMTVLSLGTGIEFPALACDHSRL